jgi:hypothetical protein
MRILKCAGLALACLVAASTVQASAADFNFTKLLEATQSDLAAAKADADAHNDVLASQCYSGVSAFLAAAGSGDSDLNITAPVGVASAFQIGRDVVKGAQQVQTGAGIPIELEQACGPLAVDVNNDIIRGAAGFTLFGVKLW